MTLSPGARDVVRREDSALVPVVSLLVAGVAVGLAWSALVPWARGLRGPNEVMAAGDVTLGLLCVLAGLGTTVLSLRRTGANPALRLTVLLVASTLAALIAWGVGRVAGAPVLQAVGVLLLWPLTVAVLNLVRSVIALLLHGE